MSGALADGGPSGRRQYVYFPQESPYPPPLPPSPGAVVPPPPPPAVTPAPPQKPRAMSAAQRRRAEALTNVFEFSTTLPQYGFAADIGDSRGVTFGRCGFCTGTGDGLLVVEEYTKRVPNNSLATYLPTLRALMAQKSGRGNTAGLSGFAAAVAALENDTDFRAVQDWAQRGMYYAPSQRKANALGLRLALARAQLYDAYVMHGEADAGSSFHPYSANGMADHVTATLGGSPATGVDEGAWLTAFLAHRRSVLAAREKAWRDALNRVDVYQWLQAAGVAKLTRRMYLQWEPCLAAAEGAAPLPPNVCARSSVSVRLAPVIFGDFFIP